MAMDSVSDQIGLVSLQVESFSTHSAKQDRPAQAKPILPLIPVAERYQVRTMAGALFGGSVRPLESLSAREAHVLVHRLVQAAWQIRGASQVHPVVLKKLIQPFIFRHVLPEHAKHQSPAEFNTRNLLWTSSHRDKLIDALMSEWEHRPVPASFGAGFFSKLHRWRSSGYLNIVRKHVYVQHDSILQEIKAKRMLRSNRTLNVVRGGPGLGSLAKLLKI